jgi:hypothetical protein
MRVKISIGDYRVAFDSDEEVSQYPRFDGLPLWGAGKLQVASAVHEHDFAVKKVWVGARVVGRSFECDYALLAHLEDNRYLFVFDKHDLVEFNFRDPIELFIAEHVIGTRDIAGCVLPTALSRHYVICFDEMTIYRRNTSETSEVVIRKHPRKLCIAPRMRLVNIRAPAN